MTTNDITNPLPKTVFEQIIEREFRKAAQLPVEARVSVELDNEEEVIWVRVNGEDYRMDIGSDDDYFVFLSEGKGSICFDIPADWNPEALIYKPESDEELAQLIGSQDKDE